MEWSQTNDLTTRLSIQTMIGKDHDPNMHIYFGWTFMLVPMNRGEIAIRSET